MTDLLHQWAGLVSREVLDGMAARMPNGIFIGQRPGGFVLTRLPADTLEGWDQGRVFDGHLELRWWPADPPGRCHLLLIGEAMPAWELPTELEPHPLGGSEGIVSVRSQAYVCVGEYEQEAQTGAHLWWEPRYGTPFAYLDTPPPSFRGRKPLEHGRVLLEVREYTLSSSKIQHRLLGFRHAGQQAQEVGS